MYMYIHVRTLLYMSVLSTHTYNFDIYRIAGNFRGVLIFVIFVTIPRVTKFSTHEFFHPRIFSRLLTSFAYRASGVTKFKTTKINSEDPRQLFTKICTPKNYPLYGICTCTCTHTYIHMYMLKVKFLHNKSITFKDYHSTRVF